MLKRFQPTLCGLACLYLFGIGFSFSAFAITPTSSSVPDSDIALTSSSSIPGSSSSLPGSTSSIGSGSLPGATSSPSSGSSTPKQTIKPLEPYKEHHEPLLRPQESAPQKHPLIQTKPLVQQTPVYFHPGMLISTRQGFWDGGDHLFNLTNSIGVFVEILKPEQDTLNISADQMKKIIEGMFNQNGIIPQTRAASDRPPLPFFHMQILCYPINKGYVVCCAGRLFESVELKRILLDPSMSFQAITWEKETLFVAPTDSVIQELQKNVATIAQSFVDRFRIYEQRKQDILRSPSF